MTSASAPRVDEGRLGKFRRWWTGPVAMPWWVACALGGFAIATFCFVVAVCLAGLIWLVWR